MSALEDSPRYWFPKSYADFVQRLRVASGFLLLLTFAWFSQPHPLFMAIGLPVSVIGLGVRAWAAGHLAKNRHLATSGPYSYIRNPLYAGTLLTALGIVIASRSAILALIFAAVFLLVYLPVIELEEQHLRNIFPEYGAYAARVHRLVPARKWNGGDLRFSGALYKNNQEYKATLGFLVAVLWLLWRCWSGART
ncbi:MAG: isoprenylcysteine carboxylmethyltransferase family protein [Acidobacteriota bacterium]|nr:isoprenylcysteine carboxylmethyltransferase family protein [Acidobacteriota bacterium]